MINPTNLPFMGLSGGAPNLTIADINNIIDNDDNDSNHEPLLNSYVPTISMPAIPVPTFSMPAVMQGMINPTHLPFMGVSGGAAILTSADDNDSNPNEAKTHLENKEHESENIFEPLFNSYGPTISKPTIPQGYLSGNEPILTISEMNETNADLEEGGMKAEYLDSSFNSYLPTVSMPTVPMPTISMPTITQGTSIMKKNKNVERYEVTSVAKQVNIARNRFLEIVFSFTGEAVENDEYICDSEENLPAIINPEVKTCRFLSYRTILKGVRGATLMAIAFATRQYFYGAETDTRELIDETARQSGPPNFATDIRPCFQPMITLIEENGMVCNSEQFKDWKPQNRYYKYQCDKIKNTHSTSWDNLALDDLRTALAAIYERSWDLNNPGGDDNGNLQAFVDAYEHPPTTCADLEKIETGTDEVAFRNALAANFPQFYKPV